MCTNIYYSLLQANYCTKYIYKHLIYSSQVVCSYLCFTDGQGETWRGWITHWMYIVSFVHNYCLPLANLPCMGSMCTPLLPRVLGLARGTSLRPVQCEQNWHVPPVSRRSKFCGSVGYPQPWLLPGEQHALECGCSCSPGSWNEMTCAELSLPRHGWPTVNQQPSWNGSKT